MTRVRAIYRNGVFQPESPVDLPDDCEVELEARIVDGRHGAATDGRTSRDALQQTLAQMRFDSGQGDLAERHNEHRR